MIARVWTTAIDELREADFLGYARTRSRAMFLEQPGCVGVFFLRESSGVYRVLSLWEDGRCMDALARSTSYQQTVQGLIATGTLRGNAEVELYEVMGGMIDGSNLNRVLHGSVLQAIPETL